MSKNASFESFDQKESVKISSNRSFGFVFSAFFLILCVLSFRKQSDAMYVWGILSGLTLVVTFVVPNFLKPFNLLWNKFGLLLHKITTPIIMGLMFFVVFFPFGFVLTLFKKLSLKKGFDSSLKSYWIERSPKSPAPESMKHSF